MVVRQQVQDRVARVIEDEEQLVNGFFGQFQRYLDLLFVLLLSAVIVVGVCDKGVEGRVGEWGEKGIKGEVV